MAAPFDIFGKERAQPLLSPLNFTLSIGFLAKLDHFIEDFALRKC